MNTTQVTLETGQPNSPHPWTQRGLVALAILVGGLLIVGGLAFALRYRTFTVPASPMAPSVKAGEMIAVSRQQAVERGDPIVFYLPGTRTPYVMRLVAVAGDRVQMKSGALFINGAPLKRAREGVGDADACHNGAAPERLRETNGAGKSYLTYDCGPGGDLDDTGVLLVPAGHYFVLGDNRDNALDSRAEMIGFIPVDNTIGVIRFILMPAGGEGAETDRWLKPVR